MLPAALFGEKSRGCVHLHDGDVMVATIDGAILSNAKRQKGQIDPHKQFLAKLIHEAWHWGEAAVAFCDDDLPVCCVPIMSNNMLLGGLIWHGARQNPDNNQATEGTRLRQVSAALLDLAIKHNLTNSAHLDMRRHFSKLEREKAEAIHALKESGYDTIREAYLREEPELLAAVKRGDRQAARGILNRLLVGIYHAGGNRMELLKSLALELIVMIYRAAVEAGARPVELLGINYSEVAKLEPIKDEVELCHWLTNILERLMDGISENRDHPNMVLLQKAMNFMEENLHQDLSRDEVAKIACVSPCHFSHLLRKKIGRSFRDLLMDYRINRASELLRRGNMNITAIAHTCGFHDPSHFGKAFRQRTGLTPLEYRQKKTL